jgi:serine protease Do
LPVLAERQRQDYAGGSLLLVCGSVKMLQSSLRRTLFFSILIAGLLAYLAQVVQAETCNKTASQVFAEVSGSVARISVIAIDPFNPRNKVSYGMGTGFLIDENRTLVTNFHVILNAYAINVSFGSGQSYWAEFVAGDPILDIALVRIVAAGGPFKALQFAGNTPLTVGDSVFAIGHPLGLKMSITSGVVSSVDVMLPVTTMSWDTPFIQTDAAINPGNSGGPLVDQCGAVVGLNSMGMPGAQSMGFAIPVERLKNAVTELLKNGKITRPWIGISGQMADPFISDLTHLPFSPGFLVETVEPGSAASEAGLQGGSFPVLFGGGNFILGGDVITSVNGVAVTDISVVAKIVHSLKVGDKIKVEYVRYGEKESLEAILPERPILEQDLRALMQN